MVTLSRNNPSELEKTLRSVALQSEKPSAHVVVDGSSSGYRRTMKAITEKSGATYHWQQPKGIYDAMRNSLDFLPAHSWVWWLNSSDWLAGTSSVEIALDAIREFDIASDPKWIVGQLIRRRGASSGIFPVGYSGRRFVANLHFGKIGFPHPSSIFWGESLDRVDAFSRHFSIAEDYALGLDFAEAFGPPSILKLPLAVHNPGGISFQRPVKNMLEKSQARLQAVPSRRMLDEVTAFLNTAPRGVWRRLTKTDVGDAVPVQLWQSKQWGSIHFCARGPEQSWPECCDSVL